MKTEEIKAVSHELAFWTEFVKTKQFKTWIADVPTPELAAGQPEVVALIKALPAGAAVLDVGSGAVSILNGLRVNVLATDPLADLYACIFDYQAHRITKPMAVAAEDLKFENAFDVVHMRNALDHTQDPQAVIDNLIRACKPGGHVIVHGFENEADFEKREGFHQTNISIRNGTLYLNDWPVDLETLEIVKAEVSTLSTGKKWVTWIAKKK